MASTYILLVALALAGQAAGEDGLTIERIAAGPADAADARWVVDEADLARLFPAVARAVASPYFLIDVDEAEQESTRAFFIEYERRQADAIEVRGRLFTVGVAIASGVPAVEGERTATSHGEVPADATSHGDVPPDATSHAGADEKRRGNGALFALAGLGLVVGLGGVGVAALAIRRG